MNVFAKLLAVVTLLASVQSFADSRMNDSERMYKCGGVVTLSTAANGDLALKFEGRSSQCSSLRFYDVTSGRTLKSYQIQGSSYTLSKSMRASLSDDCRVGFTVSNPYSSYQQDTFNVVVPWCSIYNPPTKRGSVGVSYELSNKGNCKLMKYGQYQNKNVSDAFCAGARQGDVVTFEFSNKGNCKRMINRQYTNQNVSDYFCTAN